MTLCNLFTQDEYKAEFSASERASFTDRDAGWLRKVFMIIWWEKW